MKRNTLNLSATKDGVRKYWDSNSVSYDSAPGYGGDEENLFWKGLLAETIGPGPKKILDVGCGTGAISVILAELGYEVTGIDFSDGMMKFAKEKTHSKGLDIDFMRGDVEHLEFKDGTFDCITARYVLWTLPHPEQALKEWARVVRPPGKIIVIDGKWTSKKLRYRISKANYSMYRYIVCGKKLFTDDYKKNISSSLPNPHGIVKGQLLDYFIKIGLKNIQLRDLDFIRGIQRKRFPWFAKYANDNPTFLVEGTVQED